MPRRSTRNYMSGMSAPARLQRGKMIGQRHSMVRLVCRVAALTSAAFQKRLAKCRRSYRDGHYKAVVEEVADPVDSGDNSMCERREPMSVASIPPALLQEVEERYRDDIEDLWKSRLAGITTCSKNC